MDRSVSIVRFGLIPGTSFYARQYARLTNKYFQLLQYESNGADYHDTVMVLADIPQDAEGYFYGVSDPDHTVWEMSIHKQGSKVYWKIGSVEEDHDWEPGVHCYGFVEGKPLYDGQWLGITACTTFVVNLRPFVGARNNAGGLAEGDVITSIDIYQVLLRAHQTSESTTGTLMTYYPVTDGTTGTVAKLFETRTLNGNLPLDSISGPTQQGVIPSSTPGEQVTYGVQLDDLREITGSGYRDLMAIIADDGGVDTEVGWLEAAGSTPNVGYEADTPYQAKSKDFAFCLSGVHIVDTTGTSKGSYAKGDLIRGRRPRWSIWNDSVRHGFHVVQDSAGGEHLKFNLFKEYVKEGSNMVLHSDDKVRLEWFDGYSTANVRMGYAADEAAFHAPDFGVGDTVRPEFHNGVGCRCDTGSTDGTWIMGGGTGGERLYFYDLYMRDFGFVKLGNLPFWWMSEAEQQTLNGQSGGHPFKFQVFGGMVTVNDAAQYTLVSMSRCTTQRNAQDTGYVPLCSGSSEEMKALFQYEGFDVRGVMNEERIAAMYTLLQANGWPAAGVQIRADLALLTSVTDNPTDADIIRTDGLLPTKKVMLIGDRDGGDSYDNARIVLGELGGVFNVSQTGLTAGGNSGVSGDESLIIMSRGQSASSWTDMHNFQMVYGHDGASDIDCGYGVGCPISFRRPNGTLAKLTDLFVAYIELTMTNKLTGWVIKKAYRFTKPQKRSISTSVGMWTIEQYTATWSQDKAVRNGYEPITVGNDDAYLAMFRWDELNYGNPIITPENQRPSYSLFGFTARIRFFEKSSSVAAPCAWDLLPQHKLVDYETTGRAEGSYPTGCGYIQVIIGNVTTKFMFANDDRLLYKRTAGSLIVDAWYSEWLASTGMPWQRHKSGSTYLFSNITVILYKDELHEPTERTIGGVEVARFSITGSSRRVTDDSGKYLCTISLPSVYPHFIALPDGVFGDGMEGFFNLQISCLDNSMFKEGAMYYIDLTA